MATATTTAASASWLIGVVLCSISSFGTGISKLAIRKSWLLEEQEALLLPSSTATSTTTARRLRYAAFLFISVANPILDISALAFASPSILAPFSGVSLAWVVLLSDRLVGERPAQLQIAGALLIMVGEVVVALFGDHSSHSETSLQELRDSYSDPSFLRFLLASLVLECLLVYTMYNSTNKYWTRIAWGVAGGFVTGFWNFIKDAITIVQLSSSTGSTPFSFLGFLLVSAFVTAGTGMMILSECMKRYDATYTSGTYAGSLTLCASVVSALHYHTFSNLEGIHRILYPVGLGILMLGVGLLMSDPSQTKGEAKDEETLPQTHKGGDELSSSMRLANEKQHDNKRSHIKTYPTTDRTGYLRLRTAQLV